MTHEEFIKSIAAGVQKYAASYGILVHSPIIAQAILESGWGSTKLSSFNNFFGLKSGNGWTGKTVRMRTMEEYTRGVLTPIHDDFCVYATPEEGIKGYFEWLNRYRHYDNLKGITDPETFVKTIKADGYATDSQYVEKLMRIINQYGLTKYDPQKGERMGRTATDLINVMRGWIGFSEANGKHRQIIDIYNSYRPLARGYKVRYTDEWCDTTVSAAAIKAGMTDLIGTECGCEEHVKIFKAKGIWIEDGNITPKPGYIILYNWNDATQPNDGYSDHIGVVEAVNGKTITVIEGNRGNAVSRRTIPVGWGYIRGYAAPKYDAESKMTIEEAAKGVLMGKYGNGDDRKKAIEALGLDYTTVQKRVNEIIKNSRNKKSVDEIAREVLAGRWGNGDDRKNRLTAAGYDYSAVQKRVNELVK